MSHYLNNHLQQLLKAMGEIFVAKKFYISAGEQIEFHKTFSIAQHYTPQTQKQSGTIADPNLQRSLINVNKGDN